MSVGLTERGQWYYVCARCNKPPVIMDNEQQARAADDLHQLAHRDDDSVEAP